MLTSLASIERSKRHIQVALDSYESKLLKPLPPVEIIGDNFDWTKRPSSMTKTRQVQSYHWFLMLGVQRRVVNYDLPDDCPKADKLNVLNSQFVPDREECESLENDMVFHIVIAATKYIPALQSLRKCVPANIDHPYVEECSRKSNFSILDLLDKSENKSEDMISILEHIHDNYISHSQEDPKVIKKEGFRRRRSYK